MALFLRLQVHLGIYGIIMDLSMILIDQASSMFNIMKENSLALYSVILIYILCASVLTKCFTSLLLNVYFIKIPSLTVETLEDIVFKPKLWVAGRPGLNEIKISKPDIYKALYNRIIEYENKLGINTESLMQVMNEQIAKDVANRKAVMLLFSNQVKFYQNYHPGLNLMGSSTKYNPVIRFIYVNNLTPNHKRIHFM